MIILAGGKGPIIFIFAVLILYVIAIFFSRRVGLHKSVGIKEILLLTFFVGGSLFLLSVFVTNAEILLDRSYARLLSSFSFVQSGTEDLSTMDRIDFIVFSFNHIFDDVRSMFFGYGLGSYGILSGEGDIRAYPHNIILEIWIETGFVGVFLFCCFLMSCYRRYLSANPFVWPLLYLFLNALKSSSLVDLRLFFGFLALLGMYSKK